jgi:hypothetical protein
MFIDTFRKFVVRVTILWLIANISPYHKILDKRTNIHLALYSIILRYFMRVIIIR